MSTLQLVARQVSQATVARSVARQVSGKNKNPDVKQKKINILKILYFSTYNNIMEYFIIFLNLNFKVISLVS